MQAEAKNRSRTRWLLGGVIILLTLVGFVGMLVPAVQEYMVDIASGFLLTLVTLGTLWWTFTRASSLRHFWRLIAIAWTLNVLGNVAWGVYEMVTGASLGIFSWIDVLYLLRYGVILAAFALTPRPWERQTWVVLAGVTLILGIAVWFGLYRPLRSAFDTPLLHFLGGAFYPILDGALLFAAFQTWSALETPVARQSVALLTVGLLTYGIANVFNFQARGVDPDATSLAAAIGWLLTDIFTGLGALHASTTSDRANIPSTGGTR